MPRIALAAVLALLVAAPASAQLPAGGFASPGVEFVENHATGPSSGGRLVGGFFYLTTGRDLRIFDAKVPEHPVQVGSLTLTSPGAGEQRAPEEDPDTDGKVLLTTNGGTLQVYDVRDKTAPKLAAELPGLDQHTVSCVLGCTWAYGSEGAIVDLRDPAAPKLAGNWLEQAEVGSPHDVTEIAPGLVMTATQPMALLDLRADPTKPKVLATAEPPGFVHQTLWPRLGTDDMLLTAGEDLGPACSDSASATFIAWSARDWRTSGFKMLGQFAMSTGVPPSGSAPATTFCTHWFTEHPAFRGGGLVAIGWYEHGTRFLKVGLDGKVSELGWFLPSGGRSSAAYWISDRIVYIADYYRGLDVVRWTGDIPPSQPAPAGGPGSAGPAPASSGGPPPRGVSFDDLVALPRARRCVRTLRIRARRFEDPVVRLTVSVNGRRRASTRGGAVTLRRLPRKRFTVQVLARTRSGKTTAGARSYRPCRS
jgi:hypothetical protein